MTGYIHSLESFGTVDGPGIRYVVFFQGCPMRCLYCHNPDTWKLEQGRIMDTDEVLANYERNGMFYKNGGITVTGGEPLMQLEFLIELLTKAKERGIHTCIDTSGVVFDAMNEEKLLLFEELVKVTDLVLLDMKHVEDEAHKKLTGHSNQNVLDFASFLEEKKVPIWIRYVIVPGITDKKEEWIKLADYIRTLTNFEHLEILPYHKMGLYKYKKLGIEYPLKDTRAYTKEEAVEAYEFIMKECQK